MWITLVVLLLAFDSVTEIQLSQLYVISTFVSIAIMSNQLAIKERKSVNDDESGQAECSIGSVAQNSFHWNKETEMSLLFNMIRLKPCGKQLFLFDSYKFFCSFFNIRFV